MFWSGEWGWRGMGAPCSVMYQPQVLCHLMCYTLRECECVGEARKATAHAHVDDDAVLCVSATNTCVAGSCTLRQAVTAVACDVRLCYSQSCRSQGPSHAAL